MRIAGFGDRGEVSWIWIFLVLGALLVEEDEGRRRGVGGRKGSFIGCV